MPGREDTFVNINEIDNGTDAEMEALERSWFAAHRAAEAARAELEKVRERQTAAGILADVLARLDKAERQKHEIMRQINELEDSLLTD
jgi:hypothetical protein